MAVSVRDIGDQGGQQGKQLKIALGSSYQLNLGSGALAVHDGYKYKVWESLADNVLSADGLSPLLSKV